MDEALEPAALTGAAQAEEAEGTMDQTGDGAALSGRAPEVETALSDASRALLAMIDRARQQALELLLEAERDAATIRAAAHAEGERHLDGVAQVIDDSRRRLAAELEAVDSHAATRQQSAVQQAD